MNFEFLKDDPSLSFLYKSCSDAEALVQSMPDQSIIACRKSAEALAKFIFKSIGKCATADLNFSDILTDPDFRGFIRNRDVLDAFHIIRKAGNDAAHNSAGESLPLPAIVVLHNLHFVIGECARMLGIIRDYPEFDEDLSGVSSVGFLSNVDVEEIVENLVLAYVDRFNAIEERKKYIRADDFDHNWMRTSVENCVEMHEYFECSSMPSNQGLIEYIEWYLLYLVRLSVERCSSDVRDPVSLKLKVTADGVTLTAEDPIAFEETIDQLLYHEAGFTVDCSCVGALGEYYHFSDNEKEDNDERPVSMVRKDFAWTGAGMLDELEKYKRRNEFTYKADIFYPDSGEQKFYKIENGKDVDVLALATEDILEKAFSEDWWSFSLNLGVSFDFEKYPEKVKHLQRIVRESIPKSEIAFCEDQWDCYLEEELLALSCGIQWICKSLSEVQLFLDKLNEVLLPIKDEIDAGGDGTWKIPNQFAVATWDWTEEGFKIKGCEY